MHCSFIQFEKMCYLVIQEDVLLSDSEGRRKVREQSKSLLPTGVAGCVSISVYVSVLEFC